MVTIMGKTPFGSGFFADCAGYGGCATIGADLIVAYRREQEKPPEKFKGEYLGIREMRKHVAWYVKGMKGAAKFRAQINQVESYEELEELLKMLIK